MGKSNSFFTDIQIQRRIKQGFGQGQLSSYKPWLRVQDVPSSGRSHRIYSHKTNRVHYLLSDIERSVFFILDWKHSTLDIREQFPLIIEDTKSIAKEAKIRHPQVSGVNQVMSSDFLVDSSDKNMPKFVLQVKPNSDLNDARTIEKLEIERRYWKKKEIPFFIVTEKSVSSVVHKNLAWLYPIKISTYDQSEVLRIAEFYYSVLIKNPDGNLIEICKTIDSAYQQELGQALLDLRTLMAHRFINFDIFLPWQELTSKDLNLFSIEAIQQVLHVSGK